MYSYASPLAIDTKVSTNHLRMTSLWRQKSQDKLESVDWVHLAISTVGLGSKIWITRVTPQNLCAGSPWRYWTRKCLRTYFYNATPLAITLTLLDLTKSYKNYLQNTQHVVLRNRPTLPIGTERLACLNSPRGVQLGTLAYHAAGPGFEPRGPAGALRALFFSTLTSFLLREIGQKCFF